MFASIMLATSASTECRCHIILRPHPKNRPRLSRDNKIDDISLNTHTNRLKFKPHIFVNINLYQRALPILYL